MITKARWVLCQGYSHIYTTKVYGLSQDSSSEVEFESDDLFSFDICDTFVIEDVTYRPTSIIHFIGMN